MAVICRQSKSEDADAQRTLEVCKAVLSCLWLSTKLCMLKKKKPKPEARGEKKITGSFPPMNPDNSQSSEKAPAGVERLHNSGGTS